MRSKFAFVLGAGIGYVAGTRAGREKFDRMVTQARRVWEHPSVKEQVGRAERYVTDTAREQRAQATQKATDAIKDTLGMQPPKKA